MVYDPDDGELQPDGSRIQTTTAGELADWLAENPPQSCGCPDPQPWNLCCPAVILVPAHTVVRNAPRRPRKKR